MAAGIKSAKTSPTDAPTSQVSKTLTATGHRLRAGPQRTHASFVRTQPTRSNSSYARSVAERIARRRPLCMQPIPSGPTFSDASVSEEKDGGQIATTLTGMSEIVFRHAMAFNRHGGSLDEAYDNFMAEIRNLEIQEIDANAPKSD